MKPHLILVTLLVLFLFPCSLFAWEVEECMSLPGNYCKQMSAFQEFGDFTSGDFNSISTGQHSSIVLGLEKPQRMLYFLHFLNTTEKEQLFFNYYSQIKPEFEEFKFSNNIEKSLQILYFTANNLSYSTADSLYNILPETSELLFTMGWTERSIYTQIALSGAAYYLERHDQAIAFLKIAEERLLLYNRRSPRLENLIHSYKASFAEISGNTELALELTNQLIFEFEQEGIYDERLISELLKSSQFNWILNRYQRSYIQSLRVGELIQKSNNQNARLLLRHLHQHLRLCQRLELWDDFNTYLITFQQNLDIGDRATNYFWNSRFMIDKMIQTEAYSIPDTVNIKKYAIKANMLEYHYFDLASLFFAMEDFKRAKTYYSLALKIEKKLYRKNKTNWGRRISEVAKCDFHLKNYSLAKQELDIAISLISTSEKKQEIIHSKLNIAILALRYKALALFELWNMAPYDTCHIKELIDTDSKLRKIIIRQQSQINTFKSKSLILHDSQDMYNEMMDRQFTYYGNFIYDSATPLFELAEFSKSSILKESLASSRALGELEIAREALDLEESLRIKISYYEKQLHNQIGKSTNKVDTLQIRTWNNNIYKHTLSLDSLESVFKKQHPNYLRFTQSEDIVPVEELQKTIVNKSTALIEYFLGPEKLYSFILTDSDLQAFVQPIDSIALNQINSYTDRLSSATEKSDSLELIQGQFHELLLGNLIERIPAGISNLIIVPDGELNRIPFETLRGKMGNYLGDDYAISYGFSAELLYEAKKQNRSGESLFAFAPSFAAEASATRGCEAGNLSGLFCAEKELEGINSAIGGYAFTGNDASLENFQEGSRDARIIHIATHACVDQEDPMNNKLFFADDYLSTRELLNMNLSAELAVLSACNTGSGEALQGEGVMSLSRGFAYAGVPSLVMSLWSVDDCSTAELMGYFYEGLGEGLAKDVALQQAKLRFREEASAHKKHPYFWAGFILTGDTSPMPKIDQRSWWVRMLDYLGMAT